MLATVECKTHHRQRSSANACKCAAAIALSGLQLKANVASDGVAKAELHGLRTSVSQRLEKDTNLRPSGSTSLVALASLLVYKILTVIH